MHFNLVQGIRKFRRLPKNGHTPHFEIFLSQRQEGMFSLGFGFPLIKTKTNLHILRTKTKKNLKKTKYYFENSLLLFFDVQ